MKARYYLLTALSLLVLYACEKENLDTVEPETAPTLTITTDAQNEIIVNGKGEDEDVHQDFEDMLAWSSFFLAKIINNSPDVRAEILPMLDGGSVSVLSMNDVLANDVIFNKYYSELYHRAYHEFNNGKPGDELNKPSTPLNIPPPPPPGGGFIEVEEHTDGAMREAGVSAKGGDDDDPMHLFAMEFIDYMTVYNCVEFYFPAGLILIEPFDVTSVAHPLDDYSTDNKGLKRLFTPIIGPRGTIHSIDVIVDDTYVQLNKNVIVARPKRSLPTHPYCSYTNIPVADFRVFLD